jgi:diguanylate cyclase (GGDEF)-like protein
MDAANLTELRLAAYRRILPVVVVAFLASIVVPAQLSVDTRFDGIAVPVAGACYAGLWLLAMLRRISLRTLDLAVQGVTGLFFLLKASYLSWFVVGVDWWEFFEFALYLPPYFALIFWANSRTRAWRASWAFLVAFLVAAMPHFLRLASSPGAEERIVAYIHLHIPVVSALMILFLSAYGRKEHLHQLSRVEAEVQAQIDPLTLVDNRRGTAVRLEACRRAFDLHGQRFSVILTDIDRFKLINDRHGHNVGDVVLREFARVLRDRVRGEDEVGRWGGEEFAIVLPRTRLREAAEVAEQLRERVSETTYAEGVRVTASFGVAESRAGDSSEDVVGRADAALYLAKRGGRNQVRIDGVDADAPSARQGADGATA